MKWLKSGASWISRGIQRIKDQYNLVHLIEPLPLQTENFFSPAPIGKTEDKPFYLSPEQMAANLAGMKANYEANIKILERARDAGTLQVPFDVAMQNLGKAFQRRMELHDAAVADDPTKLQAAAGLLGVPITTVITAADQAKSQASALAAFSAETVTDEKSSPVLSENGSSIEAA